MRLQAVGAYCLCENAAPADNFTDALDDLVADSPGKYHKCNIMTKEWYDCVTDSPWFPILIVAVLLHTLCGMPVFGVDGHERVYCNDQYKAVTPCLNDEGRDIYAIVYYLTWPFVFPALVILICATTNGYTNFGEWRHCASRHYRHPLLRSLPRHTHAQAQPFPELCSAYENGHTMQNGGTMKDEDCEPLFHAGYSLLGIALFFNFVFFLFNCQCGDMPEAVCSCFCNVLMCPVYACSILAEKLGRGGANADANADANAVEMQASASSRVGSPAPAFPAAPAATLAELTDLYNRANVGEIGCMVKMVTLLDKYPSLANEDIVKVGCHPGPLFHPFP